MVDMEPRIHSREAGQEHQALTPERSLAATPSGVPFGDRYQTLFQPIPKHRLNSSSLKHWRPRSLPSGSDSSSGTSDASTEICWKKYVQNHRECKCYPFLPLCPLQLLPPHEGEKRKKNLINICSQLILEISIMTAAGGDSHALFTSMFPATNTELAHGWHSPSARGMND